jgi:hypothetical protein
VTTQPIVQNTNRDSQYGSRDNLYGGPCNQSDTREWRPSSAAAFKARGAAGVWEAMRLGVFRVTRR